MSRDLVLKLNKLAKIFVDYQNKWVALDKTGEKVLSYGNTVKDVEKKLQTSRQKASSIRYVSAFNHYISPNESNQD